MGLPGARAEEKRADRELAVAQPRVWSMASEMKSAGNWPSKSAAAGMRPAPLGERHRPRIEPAVDHLRAPAASGLRLRTVSRR